MDRTINQDQLTTAFSALSVLTRNMVVDELEAALRDTNMEYHRKDRLSPEGQNLALESAALTFMIESAKKATEEFDHIVTKPEDHDRSDG